MKTTGLLLGCVAAALFASGCSPTAAPPAPPTQTTAASPTEQTPATDAPTTEPTGAQTTEAPSPETGQPPAEKPTRVDPEILPESIGEWELDKELIYYSRGHILDGDDEIVAIMVEYGDIEDWKATMTDMEEVAGGFCGVDGSASWCMKDSPTYGLVLVQGQGLEQAREISEVVFSLV
ncbi:MAG: hypothetical protein Q4G35_12585 [Propionibacteriaceae bacterium]|nr:hypothetical protein [Propionibacteriaceae bacterium]